MEAFLTLMLVIGGVILLDGRGRIKRLERRLGLVENELRRRIAAGAEMLREPEITPGPPAPISEGDELSAAAPEPQPAAEAVPEPRPAPAPEPAFTAAAVPDRPRAPRPSGLSINFEELFGRRLPIWAGGITLAIAGVLIVKYAIDIGLFGRIFTPPVQAVAGLLFGFGLIGGAEWAHRNRAKVDDPRVAQALSGAGISTLYAVVLVAANAYQLLSPLAAFIALAVVTVMALTLSLRHGAPSALLGLAGGLAAPALTVGITANVPMLAIYMTFTIAGLIGVSRAQRWPWLALIALIGGAGWSLWLILAGEALTMLGSLSIGMFVLMLAVAAPLFAFEGARGAMLRTVSAFVGAAQLALLVAMGGFEPLDWGLFALIAAAGQWLAWRDAGLRVVPTMSAALSVLLLLIWPDPSDGRLLAIGVALAAIHAGPLLARLWKETGPVQRAVELSGIAIAAPIIAMRHFWGDDHRVAWVAVAAALVALAAAFLGWKVEGRRGDSRFAWLVGSGAGLLATATLFGMPHWQVPLWLAAIAAMTLLLARRAGDRRLEWIAGAYALVAVLFLPNEAQLERLAWGQAGVIDWQAVFRWLGLAAMATLFAWRAEERVVREGGGVLAASLGYGAMAQVLPLSALPLVAPSGVLGLALMSRSIDPSRLRGAAVAFLGIIAAWAFSPLVQWTIEGLLSLTGIPMKLRSFGLGPADVLRQLFVPALLIGAGLRLTRTRLPRAVRLAGAVFAVILGIVAVHCFYRAGFAALFGMDFVVTGLAQRMVWIALMLGVAWALWKRGSGILSSHAAPVLTALAALHVTWYGLVLHNPLWADQAVGAIPLANLLAPLFAALPLCVWLIGRMAPAARPHADRALQPAIMVMVALFAWASLRQAFHGTLLTAPGLSQSEDILRSIAGIVLAVGYLLWGIRARLRGWRIASLVLMLAAVAKVFLFDASGLEGLLRIASFVALGFSLIGIGWLYSRQLRREGDSGALAAS